MNVQYINPGFEHSINSILLFQTEDETPYWSDSIYYFYPQIDQEKMKGLDGAAKKLYLTDTLRSVYGELQEQLDEKVAAYNAHWQQHRPQVEDALSEAFGLDSRPLFNDLRAYLTLNPVCPRFLQERTFDVFHLNSHRGAIGITIHEMIHFLWFHVWQRMHHDDWQEYERPHLKWILSEMVVESIMRDERLSSINPYFPRENGGCVYRYFQDMFIEGRMILDTLDEMYRACDMPAFMRASYAYCQRHEDAIRAHIIEAEKAF